MKQRRSIRLRSFDYSGPGAYYVTICTYQKECMLGAIQNNTMDTNQWGEIAEKEWKELPNHFRVIDLDKYIVMPNHIHGIISIVPSVGAGFPRPQKAAEDVQTAPPRKPTLGQVIGYFKYQVTKRINILRGTPGIAVWQRNYYERVIRNEKELDSIRKYIVENPLKWENDDYNPKLQQPAKKS